MNLYPVITTSQTSECRDFYVKAFDATVLFQSDWYVHLSVNDWEVGFLKPNPPQRLPLFQHARPSQGLSIAVEVPDARAIYQQLIERGIDTLGRPDEFPNGELAFSVMDPSGVVLNFVQHELSAPSMVEL